MPDPADLILSAADRREPAFRRAFAEAVARAQTGVPAARLTALIAAGRIDEAYRLADAAWVAASAAWRVSVGRQVRDALEAGATAGATARPVLTGRFDVTNPAATRWAQERSASLVTEVSRETRAGIRSVIGRAFTAGIAPREAARLIRGLIGLTSRQADAVLAFRGQLLRLQGKAPGAAVETNLRRLSNRGLTAARVEALVERYAGRLLRQRAFLIARTEIMTALGQGLRFLWQQATQAGELDGLERVWIVTPDDRLCPQCEPLDGARAEVGGAYPGEGGSGPPLHPACRCTEGLARVAWARRGRSAA